MEAARGRITIIGIPNHLNYWITFIYVYIYIYILSHIYIVHTYFTNVTAGRIIKPGGMRVGEHAQGFKTLKHEIYLSYIYTHTHTHTHARARTHARTHAHTHTHTHTCMNIQFLPHNKHTAALTMSGRNLTEIYRGFGGLPHFVCYMYCSWNHIWTPCQIFRDMFPESCVFFFFLPTHETGKTRHFKACFHYRPSAIGQSISPLRSGVGLLLSTSRIATDDLTTLNAETRPTRINTLCEQYTERFVLQ